MKDEHTAHRSPDTPSCLWQRADTRIATSLTSKVDKGLLTASADVAGLSVKSDSFQANSDLKQINVMLYN